MKKLSRKALQIYQEAHSKILQEVIRQKKKTGNSSVMIKAVELSVKLDIHGLMGVSESLIQFTLEELYSLRAMVSEDENEEFSAELTYSVLDVFISCLESHITPNSCLFIGSDADQEEELKRINKLLEERDLIEEVSENE